jgi:hypothetical protein
VIESLRDLMGVEQGRRRPKPLRSEQRAPLVYGRMRRAAGEVAVE